MTVNKAVSIPNQPKKPAPKNIIMKIKFNILLLKATAGTMAERICSQE